MLIWNGSTQVVLNSTKRKTLYEIHHNRIKNGEFDKQLSF